MSIFTWRARRQVRRSKPIAIRDAVVGSTVKLEGTVHAPASQLVAPASGRPCVGYRILVERVGSDDGVERVLDDTEAVGFDLRDGTASIRVDPLPCDYVTSRWWAWPLTDVPHSERLDALLDRYRIPDLLQGPRWLRPNLRIRETLWIEGARVAVFGTITGRPPASAGGPYRESVRPGIGPWDGGALVIEDRGEGSEVGSPIW